MTTFLDRLSRPSPESPPLRWQTSLLVLQCGTHLPTLSADTPLSVEAIAAALVAAKRYGEWKKVAPGQWVWVSAKPFDLPVSQEQIDAAVDLLKRQGEWPVLPPPFAEGGAK